jgi:hypothetical protein
MFEDITDDYSRSEGGERHVRTVGKNCWISVLHRMTGFGYMEWETAICFVDMATRKHTEGSPFMVRGDWRKELETMPEGELLDWYASKRVDNPISFDALMRELKPCVE